MLRRLIEGAFGRPGGDGESRHVAARIVGPNGDAEFLDSRLPRHLGLLGSRNCHKRGRPGCSTCPARILCNHWISKAREGPDGPSFIDLFSGPGGMSLGFENAGFVPMLAVDQDLDSLHTFGANRPWFPRSGLRHQDVRKLLDSGELANYRGEVLGVVGGPPCQTFSIVGLRTKQLHNRESLIRNDSRTWLPVLMAHCVAQISPVFCVMENVGHFPSALDGEIRNKTLRVLRRNGYSVSDTNVWANYHGTPQRRRRYFLVALKTSSVGGPYQANILLSSIMSGLQVPTRAGLTLEMAVAGLPYTGPGQGSEYVRENGRETWNHYARPHNSRDLEIFRLLESGETARGLEARLGAVIPYSIDSFPDKYRKLRLDAPSPTIPSHLERDANGFVMPGANRGITPREAACLQGFPLDYVFVGPQGSQFRQIGNAVPPPLAETIAGMLLKALDA